MEKTNRQKNSNIIKIVITGPESTGKSTIAKLLAKHYKTVWVEEYLRDFANNVYSKKQKLKYRDNLKISEGQLRLENIALKKADKFIFCDTDILQTIVYSKIYYNKVQVELEEIMKNNNTSLYILSNLDIEWKQDPLRDKPNERKEIFNIIEKTLIKYKQKYVILEGKDEVRLHNAIKIIDNFF
jgi:NadR type nicotinamide-nucleotide adenylyltransferase